MSWCEGEDVAKEVVVEVGQEGAGAGAGHRRRSRRGRLLPSADPSIVGRV